MKPFTLIGVDSNAFSVMGYVTNAMREAGFNKNDINNYRNKVMIGTYDMLIIESLDILDKCNEKLGLQEQKVKL